MPTVEERLITLHRRQEDMIAAIGDLATICELTRATVTQLVAWMQQPPKSELPDLLKGLIQSVVGLQDRVAGMERRLGELPADVARAVASGEVR